MLALAGAFRCALGGLQLEQHLIGKLFAEVRHNIRRIIVFIIVAVGVFRFYKEDTILSPSCRVVPRRRATDILLGTSPIDWVVCVQVFKNLSELKFILRGRKPPTTT